MNNIIVYNVFFLRIIITQVHIYNFLDPILDVIENL